jgi:hypothetical protein
MFIRTEIINIRVTCKTFVTTYVYQAIPAEQSLFQLHRINLLLLTLCSATWRTTENESGMTEKIDFIIDL